MLRFLTAGESHGQALVTIIEGMPAGLPVTEDDVNGDLARRQHGYGRGGRMKIETDRVRFLSGVRKGKTLGSPIAMSIANKDWENWRDVMAVEAGAAPKAEVLPRPGHGDLAGALKYDTRDVRDILERASARETAARVAAGALCRRLLSEVGVEVASHVVQIGAAASGPVPSAKLVTRAGRARIERSSVRCYRKDAEAAMVAAIDEAIAARDTLGGVVEAVAVGCAIGLGSHVHWDRKLDGRLAQAVLSIPAIKGVEIGSGFASAALPGSRVHDEIYYRGRERRFYRRTNNAGGLEAGITNGEPLVVRAAMKPLSSLRKPLKSVNIRDKSRGLAIRERSDVCAVPAAGVVVEAMVALVVANAYVEKFGGDSIGETKRNVAAYTRAIERR
ncbi:MAG: chorismate synthase [bacterium]